MVSPFNLFHQLQGVFSSPLQILCWNSKTVRVTLWYETNRPNVTTKQSYPFQCQANYEKNVHTCTYNIHTNVYMFLHVYINICCYCKTASKGTPNRHDGDPHTIWQQESQRLPSLQRVSFQWVNAVFHIKFDSLPCSVLKCLRWCFNALLAKSFPRNLSRFDKVQECFLHSLHFFLVPLLPFGLWWPWKK